MTDHHNHSSQSDDLIEPKHLEEPSENYFSEILNNSSDSPQKISGDDLEVNPNDESNEYEEELKSSTLHQMFKQDSFGSTWDLIPWEDIKDYRVTYRLEIFLKFFWLYFTFFFLLGPLLPLLASRVSSTLNLDFFRNVGLWGFTRKCSLGNFTMFLAHAIATPLFFLYQFQEQGTGREAIGLVEVTFMYVGIFLKVIHMANKFAIMSNERLAHYLKTRLSGRQLCREIYEGAWLMQSEDLVYDEIVDALLRYDVELRTFNFSFLVDVNENTAERIIGHMVRLSQYHTRDWVPFESEPLYPTEGKCSYYGVFVFFDILKNFEKGKNRKKHILVESVYGFIIGFIPLIYRAITVTPYVYTDLVTWITALALLYNNAWNTYRFSYLICSTFLCDLQRKKYCLIQAAHLMTAKNGEELFSVNKLLPTIDLFCPYNLKAWSILRHMSLDYGKRFKYRVEGLFTMLFICFLAQFILLTLGAFHVIKFNQISMLILLFKTGNEFLIIISILILGASINGTFNFHMNILERAKKIALDMFYYSKYYDESSIKDSTNAVVKFGFYQKSLYFDSLHEANPDLSLAEMENIYEEKTMVTVRVFERNVEELKNDQKLNPFQIMGINISYSLLQSAAMGLASVMGIAIQSYVEKSGAS